MAESGRQSLREHLDARTDPKWSATIVASLSDVARLVLRWCAFMPLEAVLSLDGWDIKIAQRIGPDWALLTRTQPYGEHEAEQDESYATRVLGYVPHALICDTYAYVKRVFPDEIENVFRFPFGTHPPPFPTWNRKQITMEQFLMEIQVAIRKSIVPDSEKTTMTERAPPETDDAR